MVRLLLECILVGIMITVLLSGKVLILEFLPTAREGNVFTGACLSTIGLMDTGSLFGLVTVWSVRILLECFLVNA